MPQESRTPETQQRSISAEVQQCSQEELKNNWRNTSRNCKPPKIHTMKSYSYVRGPAVAEERLTIILTPNIVEV